MLAARLRLLVATLWVGSIWAIGYVAAPTLFATLSERSLAGSIAGSLFRAEAWLSLACGIVLLGLIFTSRGDEKARGRMAMLIAGMLACTLIGHFGLQPFMAALRETAGPGGAMTPDAQTRFGILHGISSLIYLLQSLLGAALVLKLR